MSKALSLPEPISITPLSCYAFLLEKAADLQGGAAGFHTGNEENLRSTLEASKQPSQVGCLAAA